jgi:hypothetical protein
MEKHGGPGLGVSPCPSPPLVSGPPFLPPSLPPSPSPPPRSFPVLLFFLFPSVCPSSSLPSSLPPSFPRPALVPDLPNTELENVEPLNAGADPNSTNAS